MGLFPVCDSCSEERMDEFPLFSLTSFPHNIIVFQHIYDFLNITEQLEVHQIFTYILEGSVPFHCKLVPFPPPISYTGLPESTPRGCNSFAWLPNDGSPNIRSLIIIFSIVARRVNKDFEIHRKRDSFSCITSAFENIAMHHMLLQ